MTMLRTMVVIRLLIMMAMTVTMAATTTSLTTTMITMMIKTRNMITTMAIIALPRLAPNSNGGHRACIARNCPQQAAVTSNAKHGYGQQWSQW